MVIMAVLNTPLCLSQLTNLFTVLRICVVAASISSHYVQNNFAVVYQCMYTQISSDEAADC